MQMERERQPAESHHGIVQLQPPMQVMPNPYDRAVRGQQRTVESQPQALPNPHDN